MWRIAFLYAIYSALPYLLLGVFSVKLDWVEEYQWVNQPRIWEEVDSYQPQLSYFF